ncbi:hypothetical protein K8354_16355 [Polaribacter litorisediminis]|uniref:hypothetical protein n=1 Tax=Polaribacter litorisediminis TaxID=1908341 RepID=UPI001CBB4D7F|nr:hypothetical protein [Polaribacter litorisediminis]UAM97840.1 hypothetical protein K8354_16355 [Polaribacter litorisediminis]
MNIDYAKTLDKCDEVKKKLQELSTLLYSNVKQELSSKFNSEKNNIENWIEEIEFEITNYNQD